MTTRKEKIIVFIPMYNCEKQIPRVIAKFTPEILAVIEEIVVIDNGSQDNSVEAAKTALTTLKDKKVKLLQNKKNYSLGGSIKRAFNYSIEHHYDYVIILHGDDQGNINDIRPILQSGEYRHHDVSIGARFHPHSKLEGYSLFRRFGNQVFNLFGTVVLSRRLYDLIAGLNIYKVSALSTKFYLPFPNTLTFDAHCLLYFAKEGKSFTYFPLTWREEDQVSNAKVFRQAWVITKLFLRYLVNKKEVFRALENNNVEARLAYQSDVLYENG